MSDAAEKYGFLSRELNMRINHGIVLTADRTTPSQNRAVITWFGDLGKYGYKDLDMTAETLATQQFIRHVYQLIQDTQSCELIVVIACHTKLNRWKTLLSSLTTKLKTDHPRDFSRLTLRCLAAHDQTNSPPADGTWVGGFKVLSPDPNEVRVVCGGGGTLNLRV
jgi:hypothetical protein